MLLRETSRQFLLHCGAVTTLSEHTLRAYESDLNDCQQFFGVRQRLGRLRKDDLRRYIHHLRSERRLKEATIKRRLTTLKLVLKWAIQEELLTDDPFVGLNERIRLPKRLPKALDRGDRALLRRAVAVSRQASDFTSIRNKTAIHLLLDTGIRVGELVAINRSDVSMTDQCVVIHGKGNRQRLAYLPQHPLQRKLIHYLSQRQAVTTTNDRLFVACDGNPLSTSDVRRELHRVSREAGIARRVTPHMLRHTCATQWLESGLDIRHVQKLLGHSSISTTEIYTHVSDQGLREALLRATKGIER